EAGIWPGRRLRRRYIGQPPRSPEVIRLLSSPSPQREQGPTLESPGIAGGPAAVDHKNVPIHIGILRVGKKQRRHSDFVRVSRPAQWHMIEHPLHRFVKKSVLAIEKLPRSFGQG